MSVSTISSHSSDLREVGCRSRRIIGVGVVLFLFMGKASPTGLFLYFSSETIHLLLDAAANAEKRPSARKARLLVSVHLDAELILNALPLFFEIVHVRMIAHLSFKAASLSDSRFRALRPSGVGRSPIAR